MIWTEEELKDRRDRIRRGGDRFNNEDLNVLFAAGLVALVLGMIGAALLWNR